MLKQIRNNKNKMRIPLIIMVIVLSVGLVGSFAVWSSPNLSGGAESDDNFDLAERIEQLQASIEVWEADLETDPDNFGLLRGLADAKREQGSYYIQLGQEEEAEPLLAESYDLYMACLANAPEELNAKGEADIKVLAAMSGYLSGQEEFEVLFQEAVALAPEDFTVRYAYVNYFLMAGDYESAKRELELYRELVEGQEEITDTIDQLLALIEQMENPEEFQAEPEE